MSTRGGNRIVTDGLVLHYDVADINSYVGSGTTVNDLSGNSKHGTFINGVSFNSSNKGSLVFDRQDDHIVSTNSYSTPSLPVGNSSRTIICCFKTPVSFNLAFPYEHVVHYGSALTDGAYGIALFNIANSYYISNHTWAGTSYFTNYPVSTDTIYYVALTYDENNNPKNTFFVNGIIGNTGFAQGKTADYTINTVSHYDLHIGSRIISAEYFGGSVYFVQIYNRALTTSEILQNFNSTKSRYGL